MLGSNRDLAEVLSRVALQDRGAFDILYRATSAKLYGIILKILARRSLADEILQDVYAKIWEKAADFDAARASPITWMATIARNRALDEIRRAKVVPIAELPDGFDMAEDIESSLERLEQSDRLRSLLTCLSALDREKREVVLLAYYRGCSREALAQRYNRPAATIKTWLHRSLSQLRACLAQ
jgi:RNA polymerase sigma-70 factor (ECF subfamily)